MPVDSEDDPYVILLGKVGCGKSTIIEKVTGESGRASNSPTAYTKQSFPLWSKNNKLIICDTPGTNPIGDKFNDNIWIASAFNFRPVSKIFITVKADVGRLDGIVTAVQEFSDRFVGLPRAPLGVIVTHMDMVDFTETDIKGVISEELGIEDVVFSGIEMGGTKLIQDILKVVEEAFTLKVDHENFLILFRDLNKKKPKDKEVLQYCQIEVENFKSKRDAFKGERTKYSPKDQVDLVFEFQAMMKDDIIQAQQNLAEKFDFEFPEGPEGDNQAAHTSNLSNQMISELYKIRLETLGFQNSHGVSVLRKCPYCPCIWTKVEGCERSTTCGSRPDTREFRDPTYKDMSTYSFSWNRGRKVLSISKTGTKSARSYNSKEKGIGCGNTIDWSGMTPVNIPEEFNSTEQSLIMTDVPVLPEAAQNFNESVDGRIFTEMRNMKLPPKRNN